MQEKQLLQHTKQAIEQVTPNCFDAIWERASNANPDEYPLPDDPLPSTKTKAVSKTWIASLSVLAACILCFLGFRWYENYAIYTTIHLDVNPSIRICINRQKKILSISGLNTDGKKVVDALASPKQRPLDEVVEDTIFELFKAGYLTKDDANAILVSVETRNTSNAEELMEDLSKQISTVMGKEEVYGEIISQQMPREDKEVERIAEELHISKGKATLIRNMTLENGNFSEKDLADMKIAQILETAEKECMDISSFEQPARLRDVPAPKNSLAPSEKKDKKDGSATEKSSEDAKDADPNMQDNSTQSNQGMKQGGTTDLGKKEKSTAAPKATEKPKTTTAPQSDSGNKHRDREKQQETRREPDGSEQRGTNSDRKDSSASGTANPSVTSVPEPTSAVEDRKGRPEVTHHPDAPRHPGHPGHPRFPRDESRK